jgi:hypothetical protein
MSEYQYYEFQAVDRPLTDKEISELRGYSTRARITSTSFVNDYSWGSFKGDEDKWMEKYFDAFLYLANWGTHILKIRLPSALLNLGTVRQYCSGESAFVREKNGKVILSLVSDNEDGEWIDEEDKGRLSALVSVRADLANGDLRTLYLGWLLQAQNGELDDADPEPPVPAGLGQLSASLRNLAEFLRIDPDLLHVAAQASASMSDTEPNPSEVREWLAQLPVTEKDAALVRLVVDGDRAVIAQLLQRYRKEQCVDLAPAPLTTRTVGELLQRSEAHAEERRRIEAEKRSREIARRQHEAAVAREKQLDAMAGREPQLWTKIETLVATKQPKMYDAAIKVLMDLRDLAARSEDGSFQSRIGEFRQTHSRKPSLIERLKKAGL